MKKLFMLLAFFTLSACSKPFKPIFEKAQQQYQKNDFADAIDSLNLALSRWKSSDGVENKAQAYQLLGLANKELHKIEGAEEAFKEAIKLSTNTYASAYGLGILQTVLKEHNQALENFQKALEMKPNDPMALLGLANSYYALENFGEAKRTYQQILDTSPGVKEAIEFIGLTNKMLAKKTKKVVAPLKKPKPSTKVKSSPRIKIKRH